MPAINGMWIPCRNRPPGTRRRSQRLQGEKPVQNVANPPARPATSHGALAVSSKPLNGVIVQLTRPVAPSLWLHFGTELKGRKFGNPMASERAKSKDAPCVACVVCVHGVCCVCAVCAMCGVIGVFGVFCVWSALCVVCAVCVVCTVWCGVL